MKDSIRCLVVVLCLMAAVSVVAETPDGMPPSRETVCDNEQGAAYGLCTAYCEAMDCGDPNQRASDRGCESVQRNFERKTGRPLPCAVTCPCPGLLELFEQITGGQVPVRRCTITDDSLFVLTDSGEFAFIDSIAANCSVNNEPPFIPLDPTEVQVCRVTLRQALEAQGVVCRPPE